MDTMPVPEEHPAPTEPPTPFAAEAAAFTRRSACDGRDRHVLGWSGRRRAGALAGAVAFTAIVVATGLLAQLGAIAFGLLLGLGIAAGMSSAVDGDRIVTNRFGRRRQLPLADVREVELYRYRGAVSLRLRRADGSRGPSLPVSSAAYRLDPVAAGHVCRYLDRPDVSWGPGAWETLTGQAGRAAAEPSVPRGARAPSRPISRGLKVLAVFGFTVAVAGTVTLIVLVPVTWNAYRESQRIQQGPAAMAALDHEAVTSTSSRSGTHYTTDFRVTFVTVSGRDVTTDVRAHGSYAQLPLGSRFAVRYDPGSPTHAELPGAPMHTLATVVMFVVLAGVLVVAFLGSWAAVVGSRRRPQSSQGGASSILR